MTSDALTCKEFVELVTEYFEGSLPAEEKRQFEAHLAICDGCEIYMDQMAQTIQWTGKLAEEHISEEAQAKLLKIFREWKKRDQPSKNPSSG